MKAQVFSPDFVVASIIFLLVLTILQVYTQNMYEKIDNQQKPLYYESLVSTTDILLLYGGYPENWDQGNVEGLGLAEKPNYVNRTKVEQMMAKNENQIRSIINVEGMSFNITFSNETGVLYTKGSADWSSAENIFIVNRNAIMDEEPVKKSFIIWRLIESAD